MAKFDALRRFFLPCFSPNRATTTTTKSGNVTTKKRISTSLRDDIIDDYDGAKKSTTQQYQDQENASTTGDETADFNSPVVSTIPSRPSKAMVIGTVFGHRRGHVWFCIQHDRHNTTRPSLLLELSIPTYQLVKEMRCSGLIRIALECDRSEFSSSCPLHSVPIWTMYCNGRKAGFATRRKASDENRLMLKSMQNMTVGAGVIPPPPGSSDSGDSELMYMRANYECVVGSSDSESFHLINPEDCSGQEFSVFLLRSR